MEIADPLIRSTEARIVSDELRIWGDMRENGKDDLIREY